jgi:hypothetical protein
MTPDGDAPQVPVYLSDRLQEYLQVAERKGTP